MFRLRPTASVIKNAAASPLSSFQTSVQNPFLFDAETLKPPPAGRPMIPRPYPMDALNRAQDLSDAILSAATPPQIASACSAVESFLRRHTSDHSRAFFSIAFPALVCRLFGFDEPATPAHRPPSPSSGWIDQADADLANRLLALLSPNGALISSITAVDRHALVHYVFPIERLPEWMRIALESELHLPFLPNLCPLFKDHFRKDKIQGTYQLQLNVFEYYIFWFVYYPLCRGNSESSGSGAVRKSRWFRLESWTSPVLAPAARRSGQKPECSLYLRLLYAYLQAFVPKCRSYQPYRSSLLHYSSSYDSSAFVQAEFLVHSLIQFWMVNNDFSPLPVSLCHSFNITFPFRAVLGETPPTAGLGDALNLLVKYLNYSLIDSADGHDQKVYGGSPVLKCSGSEDVKSRAVMLSFGNGFGSWNSVIQRPLYRFILRTFLFCPVGASIRNASQVFALWVTYMMPWKIGPEDFVEFDRPTAQDTEGSRKYNLPSQGKSKEGPWTESGYTPVWQGYVLFNYLYYSSLVVHFLGFAHKFLHPNVESMIQMVSKLLNILTSSKELVSLLQKVDDAYHSKPSGPSSSCYDSLYKYLPSIREQLQDWEDGLSENDTDGSFLHENWNRNLKLFSDGEDGAHKLLQLFVLRAEHEVHTMSADVSQSLKALDSIRSQMNLLFGGGPVRDFQSSISHEDAHVVHNGCDEVFTPKHPGFGKHKWADVKYKGDWMRRPISDTEVAWLARLLIGLSDCLNEVLALDKVDGCDSTALTFVEVVRDEADHAGEPKKSFYVMLSLIGSWLGLFGHLVVRFMRNHGMRINLRMLASKKFVMVLILYAVVCALRKAFPAVLPIFIPL